MIKKIIKKRHNKQKRLFLLSKSKKEEIKDVNINKEKTKCVF